MTNREVQIVKKTWNMVAKLDSSVTGTLFYTRLSAGVPEIKTGLQNSTAAQYAKLVSMISFAVSRLDKQVSIFERVTRFAKRHVHYGVKPGHYLAVGNALIWMLAQALDEHWNEEIRSAWASCYTMLSNTMIEAAYSNITANAA